MKWRAVNRSLQIAAITSLSLLSVACDDHDDWDDISDLILDTVYLSFDIVEIWL